MVVSRDYGKYNLRPMHITVDIEKKTCVIIGKPAAGKTYLSGLLHKDNPSHYLIHTDDYIKYGYKEALYKLLMDMGKIRQPMIIEGVLGYRLLRKGVELDCFYPDIVVELEISDALMYKTYSKERGNKDQHYLDSFNKSHGKILADYKKMPNPYPPQWHRLFNSY